MLTSTMAKKRAQQNKKGVILISILFIFIIAAIFITCAIMMTSGTRSRLYDKAEENQARLSVTSAAEAFYQALLNQRIPDSDLESFCGTTAPRKITTDAAIPGFTEADDNCTTFVCTKGAGNVIYVEFTTTIGTATDSVKLTLLKTPPAASQPAFAQMVETEASLNSAEMVIGAGGAGRADNTVLVRGDAEIKGGESSTGPISNYVILGEFTPRAGFAFQGDVVLWGTEAVLNMTDAQGGGFHANNVFFINPTNSWRSGTDAIKAGGSEPALVNNWGFINTGAAFNDKTRSDVINNEDRAPENILFLSASFDGDHYATTGVTNPVPGGEGAARTYLTNGTHNNLQDDNSLTALAAILESSIIDSFGVSGTEPAHGFADRVDNYISDGLVSQINKQYPSTSDAEATIFGLGGLSAGAATPLSAATLKACINGNNGTNGHTLPASPSGYVINGATGEYQYLEIRPDGNGAQTGYIDIDLTEPGAQTFVIFVTGNVKLFETRFLVRTDNPQDFFKIVLQPNASLWIGGDSGRAGIYSSTGRDVADVDTSGGAWANSATNPKPHAYIFGRGSNTLTLYRGSMVEAYVGLYDSVENSTSTVDFADANSTNSYFLGRIMAATVKHVQGGALNIPYCVDPNSDDQVNGLVVISSDYKVVGFEYY